MTYHDNGEEELVLQLVRVDELRQLVQRVEGLEPGLRVKFAVLPDQRRRTIVTGCVTALVALLLFLLLMFCVLFRRQKTLLI